MNPASKYDWTPALIAIRKAGVRRDPVSTIARQCARSWLAYHVAALLAGMAVGSLIVWAL